MKYEFVSYKNGILCTKHITSEDYYDFKIMKWSRNISPDKTSLHLHINFLSNGVCIPGFVKDEVEIIEKYYKQYIDEKYTEIEKLFMKAGYSI